MHGALDLAHNALAAELIFTQEYLPKLLHRVLKYVRIKHLVNIKPG